MESNVSEVPKFVDLATANLSVEKFQQLETVLTFILALPIARNTYAQIIDGKNTNISSDYPKPSDRAMRLYEDFRTAFKFQSLKIDSQVSGLSVEEAVCLTETKST